MTSDTKRAYMKQWRATNVARVRELDRRWRRRHPEIVAASNRRARAKPGYKEAQAARWARYEERLWAAIIVAYGDHCRCCGESQREFLTLDHINGDGAYVRKVLKQGGRTREWARRLGFPQTLQLLCWNCNAAKHYHKACPHRATLLRLAV